MATRQAFQVAGYELFADRWYEPETHLWVEASGDVSSARVRVGFDPLGRETSGDVVEISFEPEGARVARGEAFGSVEAAKFVGPLLSPVTGTIAARNAEVALNPGLLNDDPLAHWLVEIELEDRSELDGLLRGEEAVAPWFATEVERFRAKGAIAE